jgi:hypothetical protein
MTNNINTYGTVLRSQAPARNGEKSTREPYAVHAGEQGWIALTSTDAELASLLGFTVVKIEEDPLPPTTKERYAAAVKAIRKSGIAIRQNVQACCNGCAEPFKATKNFDAETTPYAWNFAGQGSALRWDESGRKAIASRERYGYGSDNVQDVTIYFNHGNGSAARIVAAFEAEGFEVTWDGEQHSCVEVKVPASLAPRKRRGW